MFSFTLPLTKCNESFYQKVEFLTLVFPPNITALNPDFTLTLQNINVTSLFMNLLFVLVQLVNLIRKPIRFSRIV